MEAKEKGFATMEGTGTRTIINTEERESPPEIPRKIKKGIKKIKKINPKSITVDSANVIIGDEEAKIKRIVKGYIEFPILNREIDLTEAQVFYIYGLLKDLEERVPFPINLWFFSAYCTRLEKEFKKPYFSTLEKIVKEVGKNPEVYRNKKKEVSFSVYEIQKRFDDKEVDIKRRLELLKKIGGYISEKLGNFPPHNITYNELIEQLEYYIKIAEADFFPSRQEEEDPFWNNIRIRQNLKKVPANNLNELIPNIREMDEKQLLGKKLKKEIIRDHFDLIKEESEDPELLKEKYRIFSQVVDSMSEGKKKRLKELEQKILEANAEDITTPEEAFDYCQEMFGKRWFINLPDLAEKKDFSLRQMIGLLRYSHLLDHNDRKKIDREKMEEAKKNRVFLEEKIAEIVKQRQEEMKDSNLFDLYLVLQDLKGFNCCTQVKHFLQLTILTYCKTKPDWDKYEKDFQKLIVR